jgi:hypothetical protein
MEDGPPTRVWVKHFNHRNGGRPLRFPQTIEKAINDIMKDPTLGQAIPLIPGVPANDVNYSEDISTIGSRQGMIVTVAAAMPDGALETEFLIYEKLRTLRDANAETPGLYTKVLGIQDESVFDTFFFRLRDQRNRAAHPSSRRVVKGNIEEKLILIPEQYRGYAKRLIKWDGSS